MLQTLRVRNLALVENVAVEFQPGLNAITGETGAGKSMLVGALNLLLGDRADRTMVRSGEDQCVIEAAFHLADAGPVNAVLAEVGLEPCEKGMLLLRRSIQSSGAGRNFINDGPATIQVLKKVGERLIDMHGPHDHQSLLSPAFQMDLLDAFGRLQAPRAKYQEEYLRTRELLARRKELDADDTQVAQQIEMLTFQVKEIEAAAPVEGEDEEIVKEQAVIANARRILELAEGVRNALTEGETSAFNSLAFVQQAFTELQPLIDSASAWRDEARSVAIRLQELSSELGACARKIDADPQRLQWLEDRMATYHKMKRKYGAAVPQILDFLRRSKERLRDLETRGQQIADIDAALAKVRAGLAEVGGDLSRKRRAAAQRLAKAVTQELRELGFEHGAFAVELREREPGESGLDEIEFGFAPNLGEPLLPLRTIASSGEISRVMLATKAVLAAHDRIPVLVFDEIDTNIGGKIAGAVGAKMAEVSRRHQVLCITHLPQVAVYGDVHLAVTKTVEAGRTRTQVDRLDGEKRVEEIARMLGGRDLTSVTLKHAREMLHNARA